MNREPKLEVAIKAAVSAGNLLLEHYNDIFNVTVKESLRDVVTEVDRMAEDRIIEILQEYDSEFSITTEEHGEVLKNQKTDYWIVDALDGTVNYVNRVPFFCVSIAFIENNQPVVGVIYNPMSEDLYYGAEGVGVFKNQNRLKVKDRLPEDCLFAVAFSGKNYDIAKRKDEFILFYEINDLTRGCLRTGSAAMNLAYLSEGKFGGCWGKANKFWDVAAGLLLAKLSGAKVEFREIDREKHLASYLATVSSSWEFVYRKVNSVLKLS